MSKLYCLETPEGELVYRTLANTKRDVWSNSFDYVGSHVDGFTLRYWHKFDASLAAAKRLGYKIVNVKVVKDE